MISIKNYYHRFLITISKPYVVNIFLIAALIIILVLLGLKFDIRANPVVGDEASFVLQALSIANDGDLKYEEKDFKHWEQLEWQKYPVGLFFQKYSGGYAFAKPYGYSLFLALFLVMFGKYGFMVGNIILLGLVNLFILLSLRSFYGKLESVLLTVSFTFFSYLYMYTFYMHPDLFLAMLSSMFIFLLTCYSRNHNQRYLIGLSVLAAFMFSEKMTLILAILPVLILLFYKTKSYWKIINCCVVFLIGVFLFILPYLHYSDYKAWNPYNTDRYYGNPFPLNSEVPSVSYHEMDTNRFFKLEYVTQNAFEIANIKEKAISLYYYFVGAYTGVIVFIPFVFLTMLHSIFRVFKKPDPQLILPLSGVFAYILFYVALFTHNYYGGAGSLGNRYFLQIAPFTIPLLLTLKLRRKNVFLLAILSFGFSMLFIYHHHRSPWNAYVRIMKSNIIQDMMPAEKNQRGVTARIPSKKRVNAAYYPSVPRYVKGHYIIDLEGKFFVVQKKLQKYGWAFFKADDISDIFIETNVNGKTIWVNNGFHDSEKSHIWSKTKSTLMIRNTKTRESFLIKYLFIPRTKVYIFLKNKEIIVQAPIEISIDTKQYKNKWIPVHFKSDKSGIPANIYESSGDIRELSFALSFNEISENNKH